LVFVPNFFEIVSVSTITSRSGNCADLATLAFLVLYSTVVS